MPKINAGKSGKLLWIFLFRMLCATLLCYGSVCAILALIIFKTDANLDYVAYLAIGADAICAFFIAKFSVGNLKNNRTVMSIISVLPCMIYSVVNYCLHPVGIFLFIIRLLIIPSCAVLASFGKKKIKV